MIKDQKISELIQLYANVFMKSFIAHLVYKIDITAQVKPITDNLAQISVIKTLQTLPSSELTAEMLF